MVSGPPSSRTTATRMSISFRRLTAHYARSDPRRPRPAGPRTVGRKALATGEDPTRDNDRPHDVRPWRRRRVPANDPGMATRHSGRVAVPALTVAIAGWLAACTDTDDHSNVGASTPAVTTTTRASSPAALATTSTVASAEGTSIPTSPAT